MEEVRGDLGRENHILHAWSMGGSTTPYMWSSHAWDIPSHLLDIHAYIETILFMFLSCFSCSLK